MAKNPSQIVFQVTDDTPKPPWFKVNVDATMFEHLKEIGVGVVIRDHEGFVIAVMRHLARRFMYQWTL